MTAPRASDLSRIRRNPYPGARRPNLPENISYWAETTYPDFVLMIKRALKAILPPAMVHLGRRLIPSAPMFSGVYASPDEITDERPWLSEERLAYAKQQLETALAVAGEPQPLMGSLLVPCLLVNLLSSQGRSCKVLDFGGGTGVVYFQLRKHLTHGNAVTWVVTDNDRLIRLGEEYKDAGDNIYFYETVPNEPDIDVIFINTALQYVTDCWSLLSDLVKLHPKHFVFTRLIAGDIKTHFSRQNNIQGGKTPCLFLNVHELVRFFAEEGFDLIHCTYAAEDTWERGHYEGVPPSAQIRNTMNLLLQRKDTL